MIGSFKDSSVQQLFEGVIVLKWRAISRQVERRLQILDSATCIDDLRNLPSNHFEALKGDRKGQFSIRVNIQWRLCFKWQNNKALDVELIDYH